MRILVTRPEEDARQTAQALRLLGHEPVVAPLTVIEPTLTTLPHGNFAAVVVTSANALRGFQSGSHRAELSDLALLPVYAVGERTAKACQAAGFRQILQGQGNATQLAEMIIAGQKPADSLLFLAGQPRKPDLELRLQQAGLSVKIAEVYRSKPVAELPLEVKPRLIKAVLHYSHVSAARFVAAVTSRGDARAWADIAQLCLSQDVASGLASLGCKTIYIADNPSEPALFALLAECR